MSRRMTVNFQNCPSTTRGAGKQPFGTLSWRKNCQNLERREATICSWYRTMLCVDAKVDENETFGPLAMVAPKKNG